MDGKHAETTLRILMAETAAKTKPKLSKKQRVDAAQTAVVLAAKSLAIQMDGSNFPTVKALSYPPLRSALAKLWQAVDELEVIEREVSRG